MLDWTDRHFRYFIRLLSPHCLLYTEMITTGALLRGDAQRFLAFSPEEHPIALQVGGSDPEALAQCARLAKEFGYDEINLNVGCPSDRVQKGRFGACLMKEPGLVAECVAAMRDVAGDDMNVTVKCRIGVDEQEEYSYLENFVDLIQRAGCRQIIVHARKAWLSGLSPKENREIPPLNYPWVYQLKRDFPELTIVINGAIKTVSDALMHLEHVDGVMVGRPAYENPYFFRELEEALFSVTSPLAGEVARLARDRGQLQGPMTVIQRYLPYVEEQLSAGVRLSTLVRPMLGIFNGLPGSRLWRRHLSTHCHVPGADIQVVTKALTSLNDS
ncbi:MAG: tRNA dihydrouridine(20/20a) synthase DusA [Gammaproteobacteria bacterium]|nr:tRNA dihydrouridine(20/20a) synthase DusA [Gammaproteobacteria bacterium]